MYVCNFNSNDVCVTVKLNTFLNDYFFKCQTYFEQGNMQTNMMQVYLAVEETPSLITRPLRYGTIFSMNFDVEKSLK